MVNVIIRLKNTVFVVVFLQVCLTVNGGCIIVAFLAVLLISVDLAKWDPQNEDHLRVRHVINMTKQTVPLYFCKRNVMFLFVCF